MDQAQTRALAALQQFIHLATTTKSPSDRFLADLVSRATSAPGTYIFTELLQLPTIQSLRSKNTPSEFQAYLTVLEIFSYGTYEEYKSRLAETTTEDRSYTDKVYPRHPNLPPLSEPQTLKLRQLSLLTLASSDIPLTYPNLLSALSLTNTQELEALITSAIYASLLTARLSPTSDPPMVHITSVAPLRDIRPQSLTQLLNILSTWQSRCDTVITDLTSQIDKIKSNATKRRALTKKRQEVVDAAVLTNSGEKGDSDSHPPPIKQSLRGGKHGKGGAGGNNLKRDLEEHDDDGYEELPEDANSGGDDGNGGMDLDEPTGASGAGGASIGSGNRGNKKSRGKVGIW